MSSDRRNRRSGRKSRERTREILCQRRDATAARTGDAAITRDLNRPVQLVEQLPQHVDLVGQLPLFGMT